MFLVPDRPNHFPHAFPILTPLGNKFPFDDLFSMYGHLPVEAEAIAEYIVLVVLIVYILHNRGKKLTRT